MLFQLPIIVNEWPDKHDHDIASNNLKLCFEADKILLDIITSGSWQILVNC